MAGFYPLAFSTSTTHGVDSATSVDRNINPYFYIHDSNNNSIFSPTESPAKFDVYTFSTTPSQGDESPKISYAVVIIKNMGTSTSLVTLNDVSVNLSTNDSVPQESNPFSIVNRFENFEVFGGSSQTLPAGLGILTPPEFDELLGPNGEANTGMRNNKPLAYIKIENNTGNVDEDSFDGTGVKFIPVFRTDTAEPTEVPEAWQPTSLCTQIDNNDGIGARQIGNTTYPEYAAIVIKCKPQVDMDTVGGELELYFGNPSTFITIGLHVTAFRKGDVSYTQGWWNTGSHTNQAPSFQPLNGELGSGISLKVEEKTAEIDYAPVTGGLPVNQNNYPQTFFQVSANSDESKVVTYQASADFDINNIARRLCPGFYPVGYNIEESNAHVVGTADSNIDYSRFIIRATDSTLNPGGVRFLHGFRTNLAQNQYKLNQPETNNYVFNRLPLGSQLNINDRYNATGDAPLQYLTTLGSVLDQTPVELNVQGPDQQQFLGGFSTSAEIPIGVSTNAVNYDLEARDVYIKVSFKGFSPFMYYYKEGANPQALKLHPNLGNHFSGSNELNRRVNITAIPFFHNQFFINENAALDGVNQEKVFRDTLYVATGNYFIWSTNVETLSRFGRMITTENLNNQPAFVGIPERFSDFNISEDVSGANEIPDAYGVTGIYKEMILPNNIIQATYNISNSASALDGSLTPVLVWKHKHIFDFFNIQVYVENVTSPYMQVQFNNLSGLDDFYCDEFPFTNSPTIKTFLLENGQLENFQIVRISSEKFIPLDLTDSNKQSAFSGDTLLTAFKKTENTVGGAWDELSGGHYLAGSKKKTTHIRLQYRNLPPGPSYGTSFFAWDGISNPSADSENQDPLGRYIEDAKISFSNRAFNAMTGDGSAVQQFCGNDFNISTFQDLTLGFNLFLHGRTFLPAWEGFKITQFESFSSTEDEVDFIADALVNSNNTTLRPWVRQELYITSFCEPNSFGSHGVTASNIVNGVEEGKIRNTLSDSIIRQACQGTLISGGSNSSISSNSDLHGLTLNGAVANGLKGVRHEYAVTDKTKKYYYRKYPLNGKCCFKYERYFKDRVLHTQTAVDGQNDNYEPYGILPGPLAEGRFKANGQPYSLKAPSGTFNANDSKTILSANVGPRNTSTNVFEIKIPFNLHNNNYQAAQIVSIDLENRVGSAGSHLYSVSPSFGDPRYINGDSTKGEYRTALHTVKNDDNWSAPYLGGTSSPTMDLVGDITSGHVFTFADNSSNPGYSSAINKMTVVSGVDSSGAAITIPAGTHAWLISTGTLHFKNGVSSSATNITLTNVSGATFTFDYPKPNYAIWDIIAHPNTPTTQESLYEAVRQHENTSDGVVGNNVLLRSFNRDIGNTSGEEPNTFFANSNLNETQADAFNGFPEEKFINNEMVILQNNANKLSIQNDNPTIYNPVGYFPVGIFENVDSQTLAGLQTLYGKYTVPDTSTGASIGGSGSFGNKYFYDVTSGQQSTQAFGVPVIYFAIDGAALGSGPDNQDGSTTSDTNNNFGSEVFINRLRIRYILHEKLDAYGVNQKRLTGSTQNGIDITNSGLDEIPVYEDTYLISVTFNNEIPTVVITDIEGDEKADQEAIDFGTMQIG
jgi:hypothetical protein